jgi:hypothetical protein
MFHLKVGMKYLVIEEKCFIGKSLQKTEYMVGKVERKSAKLSMITFSYFSILNIYYAHCYVLRTIQYVYIWRMVYCR